MSLTVSVKNRLLDAINMAFDAVGIDVHTKMPRAPRGDNKSPVAWELFVASHLVTRARARYDVAKKAAIDAGVMPDPDKNPREPGTNEQVFAGEHVAVWLTVNKSATRVDADKLCAYLIAKGVKTKLVEDAYEHASSKTRPAHIFKVSLIAENGSANK